MAEPTFHPDFGRLICKRRGSFLYWLGALFVVPLGLLSTALGIGGVIAMSISGNASAAAGIFMLALLGGTVLWVGITMLIRAATTVRFYEQAAVRRRWGRELVIRYLDAVSLSFGTEMQHLKGAYIGTLIQIAIADAAGHRIKFSGGQHERVSGMFWWRKIESIDELEKVKDIISENIADAWELRILSGEEVPWCGRALISAEGLRRYRRHESGKLTPWTAIVRSSQSPGWQYFHRRGESDAFIQVSKSRPNFLPGLTLIHRLLKAAHQPQSDATAPFPI